MDELNAIKQLAGITNKWGGYVEYTPENMSKTASEIKKIEKEKNIKPGDKEWFELWFSKPYMTGKTFRGRKKNR